MIEHLNSLSLEKKVGQLFFIGISGPSLDGLTRDLLNEVSPGGVCLFARNLREAAQTRELLDGVRSVLRTLPFLSIDQEGGTVDRLRRIISPMPAAARMRDIADVAESGRLIAQALRILGFNMDFAPVVDVVDEVRRQFSKGLASRTFGRTHEEVTEFTTAFLQALQDNGVLGCLKHFPGLGAATADSHEELPQVEIDESELYSTDLYPYRKMLSSGNVHAVMAAHASFPGTSLQETEQNGKLLPSSLSYNFVTKLLRGDLAFDGLVLTDDLEMGAIINNYGIGAACRMAILAGADMLLICADPAAIREGFNSVLRAVRDGRIGEDRIDASLCRISAVKELLSSPVEFDAARLDHLSGEIAAFGERMGR